MPSAARRRPDVRLRRRRSRATGRSSSSFAAPVGLPAAGQRPHPDGRQRRRDRRPRADARACRRSTGSTGRRTARRSPSLSAHRIGNGPRASTSSTSTAAGMRTLDVGRSAALRCRGCRRTAARSSSAASRSRRRSAAGDLRGPSRRDRAPPAVDQARADATTTTRTSRSSPDGTRVAYRDRAAPGGFQHPRPRPARPARTASCRTPTGRPSAGRLFSPDGTQVAYLRARRDDGRSSSWSRRPTAVGDGHRARSERAAWTGRPTINNYGFSAGRHGRRRQLRRRQAGRRLLPIDGSPGSMLDHGELALRRRSSGSHPDRASAAGSPRGGRPTASPSRVATIGPHDPPSHPDPRRRHRAGAGGGDHPRPRRDRHRLRMGVGRGG